VRAPARHVDHQPRFGQVQYDPIEALGVDSEVHVSLLYRIGLVGTEERLHVRPRPFRKIGLSS